MIALGKKIYLFGGKSHKPLLDLSYLDTNNLSWNKTKVIGDYSLAAR